MSIQLLKFVKRNILFFALIPIVIISQVIILRPHLDYGFSDVDWGFLSIYKNQNPYSLSQFINNFKVGGTIGGVYTHQIYYIGVQNDLFGLNFRSFQITTHIFKILAILAVFPLFLAISGSSLAAFIATILFAFSYSAVGTMYTVVTSSDYSAIFSMGIFVWAYWYVIKKNFGSWLWMLMLLSLLVLTLFLSTERMYQLPVFIALIELFMFWQRRQLDKNSKKRIIIMFLPLFLVFLVKPIVFLDFLQHGVEIIQGITSGELNLLLTPFIVLGSILLPHDYAKYFGIVKIESLGAFLDFIISGPLPVLTGITIFLSVCIFKRPHIKIFQIIVLTLFFWFLLYIAGSHFVNHLLTTEAIMQSLVGVYILIFAGVSLLEWLKSKERFLIGLFTGPFLAFLYILLTWVGASIAEIFSGAHRYLTIPALFICLFLGTLFAAFSKRLKFFALFPVIIFVLLFIKVNTGEITSFFNSQLQNGFGAQDKQLMRNQLIELTPNLSKSSPSLFYFDFSQDQARGYYYDNTITGGFGAWMLWHPSINLDVKIAPRAMWNDLKNLKSLYGSKDGRKGFYLGDHFFELSDFYAFGIKDRKVADIRDQILRELDN